MISDSGSLTFAMMPGEASATLPPLASVGEGAGAQNRLQGMRLIPSLSPGVLAAVADRPQTVLSLCRLLILLCLCHATVVRGATTITVATYNILFQNPDLPGVVTVIREAQADLVCLQETNADSEKFLRAKLGGEYPHQVYFGGKGSDGLGVLSKTPLRGVKFLEPKFGTRGTVIGETQLGGTNVQFANLHLTTPKTRRVNSLPGVLKMFADAGETHGKEIARIHETLAPDRPTLVLGDFNSFSFSAAQTFLKRRGFSDSAAAVNPQADEQPTWRGKFQESEWRFRIDYIFTSTNLMTASSRVIKSDTSDHHLVVSRLTWP